MPPSAMPAIAAPYDLAVIGAGPAGMAATLSACELGLRVALIDEQHQPGGQIYRAAGASPLADVALLGPDYRRGRELVAALRACGAACDYYASAAVWQVTPSLEIGFSAGGRSRLLRASAIVAATGAMERPMPIPGWTLPGVMTAGAGQIAMKSAGFVPVGPVVLAGSGPLLFLVAWQYLNAGVTSIAVVETTPVGNHARALRHLPRALRAASYLRKGVTLIAALAKAGVPIRRGARDLRVLPDESGRVGRLQYRIGSRLLTDPCNLLLLHQGVVPNTQLTRSLDCAHAWDEGQRCWRPVTDKWGASSLDGLWVAGDGAGIGGALAAESQGRLAALDAARSLGRLTPDRRDEMASAPRRQLSRNLAIRPFLDALYAPAPDFLAPPDETVVCRCEEVTAGDIRRFVAAGCTGPNQLKIFSRCGMGPCQGRSCGLTAGEIIAAARGVPVPEAGYYRIRAPLKPVTLGQLSDLSMEAD